MGRAFYKGYSPGECACTNILLTSTCRGFDPRMSRREAALILELSYVPAVHFRLFWSVFTDPIFAPVVNGV